MPPPELIFESDLGTSAADAGGSVTSDRLGCDTLFSASREPILIIDAASGLIIEANPSSVELLCSSHGQLIGAPLKSALHQYSAAIIEAGFALAQLHGGTHALSIPTLLGQTLWVRVSVFNTAKNSYFLMRLGPQPADRFVIDPVRSDSALFPLIDEAPVGFVLTDANFQIDYANRAFLAMIDLDCAADVRGKYLARWLNLTVAQLAGLQMQLSERQAVSQLQSSLRCSRNHLRHVEVHAIAVPDDRAPCWGFSVHVLRSLN